MSKPITYVGIDAHKAKLQVAILVPDAVEPTIWTVRNEARVVPYQLGVSPEYRWLCSVLRGHYRYYGLPTDWPSMNGSCEEVRGGWYRALRHRSQRRLT